jgi:hypothetical protein
MDFRWSDAVKNTYRQRIHGAQVAVNAALSADGSTDTTALRHQAQKLAGTASLFGDIHVETTGYQLDHFLKDHPRNHDTKDFLLFAQRFKEALDQSKYN